MIGDIQTYEANKVVPLKVKVRDIPGRDPVDLRRVAQALHLKDIDIASSQATGNDAKGPFVAFHPKPYSVAEYRAEPGKVESPTADLDAAISKLAQRLNKERGRGPFGTDPLDGLFK